MNLYPYLYYGEELKEPGKVLHKLKKADKKLDAYVVLLSENPSDQLEIRQIKDLFGKVLKSREPMIIGIGKDYDDCVKIVERIAGECFKKNRNGNLKTYLRDRVI